MKSKLFALLFILCGVSSHSQVVMSCNPLDYVDREYYQENRAFLFTSFHCFPVEADSSTWLIGWDPVSEYATKMNKEWVFPTQTGLSGSVLTTNGTNTSWTSLKRQETYTGLTDSTGVYTITYGTIYTTTPNVQFSFGPGASNKETVLLTVSNIYGCSFYVQLRNDSAFSVPTYNDVENREINVLVTEK